MATYSELRDLFAAGELRNRVEVACIIAADTIRGEDVGTVNHTNRMIWAKKAFESTASIRDEMLKAVLAANKDAEPAQITGASDAVIQAKVDEAVDLFADGS